MKQIKTFLMGAIVVTAACAVGPALCWAASQRYYVALACLILPCLGILSWIMGNAIQTLLENPPTEKCPICDSPALYEEETTTQPPQDAGGGCADCGLRRLPGQTWKQAAKKG